MPTWCLIHFMSIKLWSGLSRLSLDLGIHIGPNSPVITWLVSLLKMVGCNNGNKINCKSEGNQACYWEGRVFRYGEELPISLHRWTLVIVYRIAFWYSRYCFNWVRTEQMDCHLLKWKSVVQMNCIYVTVLKSNNQTKEWRASQKYYPGRSQELSNVVK